MARFGKSYVRKCSNCCPDGGAYCKATCNDEGESVWVCNNCGNVTPRRINKRTSDKPTPSQELVLNKLLSKDHAVLKEKKMIGRQLFVSVHCQSGNIFSDKEYTGSIGPKGSINITYYFFGGHYKIKDIPKY